MKKLLLLLMLVSSYAYGQNDFKYVVNALGGIKIGNSTNTIRIDSLVSVGGVVSLYRLGVQLQLSGTSIDTTNIKYLLSLIEPDSIIVADTEYKAYSGGAQLVPSFPDEYRLNFDTALLESQVYKDLKIKSLEPWKLIYPGSDVVAKAYNTDMHPASTSCPVTATDSRMYLSLYYVDKVIPVTGARAMAGGGTDPNYVGDNYNGFVIYRDSSGTAVFVDSTVNDPNIWKKKTGSIISANFSNNALVLQPGWYYVGTLANHSEHTTAATLIGWSTSYGGLNLLYGLVTQLKYRVQVATVTYPPASINIVNATQGIHTSDIVLFYTAP